VRHLLTLAAALLLAACGSPSGAGAAPGPIQVELGDSPQRGPSDAWVTVVEFSDFECPFCGAEEPALRQLLHDLPADVRLVYKHFPLYPSPHPHSRDAAVAAECARLQGAGPDGLFWAMHDVLFADQASLDPAGLRGAAEQIAGLDVSSWSACLARPEPLARVLADQALGASAGVRATPTLAINGERLEGAVGHSALRSRVDAALALARASGIARADYYQKAVLGR
jgi:protein-disulfide isomerase